MIIASNQIEPEEVDFSLLAYAESLISQALLYDYEKNKYIQRLIKCTDNEQIENICNELQEYQPIMGYHAIPTNIREAALATKLRIERDERNNISNIH